MSLRLPRGVARAHDSKTAESFAIELDESLAAPAAHGGVPEPVRSRSSEVLSVRNLIG